MVFVMAWMAAVAVGSAAYHLAVFLGLISP